MNKSNNDAPHDRMISELYAQLKQDLPPKHLDQSILKVAQQQLKIQNKSSGTNDPKVLAHSAWRRWQWPMSIAASVVFISVIFIGQQSFFIEQSFVTPNQTALSPAPAPIKPLTNLANNGERGQLINSQSGSKDNDISQRSVLSIGSLEKVEHISVAASRTDTPTLDNITVTGQRSVQAQQQQAAQKQEQQKAQIMADKSQQKTRHLPSLDTSKTPSKDNQQLAVIDQQLEQTAEKLALKLQALSELKRQSTQLRDTFSQMKVAPLSLAQLERNKLDNDIATQQHSLFELMQQKRANEPHWLASPELVNLLSREQQAQWAAISKDKEHE